MRKLFVAALLVMGLSGLIAQIVLLREMLVIFSGNELSIGVILANWLVLEAAGAFLLGKVIEKTEKKIEIFAAVQLAFSLFLPAAVYWIRGLKGWLGVIPGEGLGLWPILYSSFFIFAFVSLPHGALFTFGCKIFSRVSRSPAVSVGHVYVYETLGTIIGGVILTFFLITQLHSFQIVLGVSFLNLLFCVLLLSRFCVFEKKPAAVILAVLSALALLTAGYMEFSPGADRIHWRSIRNQWKGRNVVHYQNSIYGNIAVLKSGGQYTFLSDGIPAITTPVPDITFVEEFAHLTLLSHPHPENILVLSGGAGGIIKEILKHPVQRIDYAELDPVLLDTLAEFSTPLTLEELNDPRVRVSNVDGRLFTRRTKAEYDIILIGLSDPSDLQTNRLFTREFYSALKDRLKHGGIVTVTLPGSLTYLNESLLKLNACILTTLKSVYPHVKVIPGDFNLFLASESPDVSRLDSNVLVKRFSGRGLKTRLITRPHIEYRLAPRWLEWFEASLAAEMKKGKINFDFLPRAVFYSMAWWSSIFSPKTVKFLDQSGKINLWQVVIVIGLFTAVFLLVSGKKNLSNAAVPLAITFTGFAGMVYNMVLIFAFQAAYGYVYQWIGILVTAFMAGAAAGSFGMVKFIDRIKKNLTVFIMLEGALVLFSFALPFALIFLYSRFDTAAGLALFKVVFLLLCFLSGLLTGAQFPLAGKMQLMKNPGIGHTAGLLYAGDLLGGWLGGIIGGIVLLPVLGLAKTCAVVGVLKLSSLILVAKRGRRD